MQRKAVRRYSSSEDLSATVGTSRQKLTTGARIWSTLGWVQTHRQRVSSGKPSCICGISICERDGKRKFFLPCQSRRKCFALQKGTSAVTSWPNHVSRVLSRNKSEFAFVRHISKVGHSGDYIGDPGRLSSFHYNED